jgi:hypothetical protein
MDRISVPPQSRPLPKPVPSAFSLSPPTFANLHQNRVAFPSREIVRVLGRTVRLIIILLRDLCRSAMPAMNLFSRPSRTTSQPPIFSFFFLVYCGACPRYTSMLVCVDRGFNFLVRIVVRPAWPQRLQRKPVSVSLRASSFFLFSLVLGTCSKYHPWLDLGVRCYSPASALLF